MSRLIPTALTALALAACAATPTVYQPATGPQAVGYSDYQIEPGRYRITFRGGPGAPERQVSEYALLRAAELAIAGGYDWFRVADLVVEGGGYDPGPRIGLGVGSTDFGRHSAVGVGLGTSFSIGGGPSLAATVEVVMGRGPRPRTPDAYDARALRRGIGGPV